MSSQKRLAVIVVNYRTPSLVFNCLASLEPEIEPGQDVVVVVDNDSKDGSAKQIEAAIVERAWAPWARVVRSPVNGGFSAGNNIGIGEVAAEAYLLLNSDTTVRPGAVRELLDALRANPRAGMVSPRLEGPDGTPHVSCFRYVSPLGEVIRSAGTGPVTRLMGRFDVPVPPADAPTDFEWTSFACILVRNEVLQEVGLMDEGYFMYYEDLDFCRRARNAGWGGLHWPRARVVHLHGKSSEFEVLTAARKRRPRYYYESRARYFAKFYGRAGLWAANLLWLAGRGIAFVREVAGRKQPHCCEREWLDIWTNWWRPLRPRDATGA